MPRTPKQFKEIREKTRRKILESALELFATRGYHGTSINDIAKKAGISKGLAYNYFESKQDLVRAILNTLFEIADEMEKQIDWDGDPYEAIRTIITATFKFMEESGHFWKMYTSFSLQPVIFDESINIYKEFMQMYFDKLEKTFRKIGVQNPKAEAKIFGAILDGAGLHYFIDMEGYSLRSVKNHLLKKYSKEELDKLIK